MNPYSRRCIGFFVVAACWSAPAPVQAEIVVNGGFETGGFFPWIVPPNVSPPSQNAAFFGVASGSAHSGNRYAVLSSMQLRFMSQILPTEAGTDYELSFWLRRPSPNPAPIPFVVRWEGQTVFNDLVGGPLLSNWTQFTIPLHANITTSFLEFGQSSFPGEFHIDDISVVAVPAPGAAPLLALGGAVVVGRRRRR